MKINFCIMTKENKRTHAYSSKRTRSKKYFRIERRTRKKPKN